MIVLKVPASLQYRDVAMRVVAAACKIYASDARTEGPGLFHEQVVSAFGEAFNNALFHAYRDLPEGQLIVEVGPAEGALEIRIIDDGRPFDPSTVPVPDLDALPERGMGLFIIRAFMDEVVYRPGPPNALSLRKRF
ncbi:MAG: ATP-binding protein [Deltaproteobacteria bacterium]|nr:ATP-binding protein [Deltaproteobacteria bacterium]